jgi:anti-sigma-K factor RskA
VNIQEYILSGIVESYVLGLASTEERAEFENMCSAHAEVRAARDAFEGAIEKQAFLEAATPPAHLKSRIFGELDVEADRKRPGKLRNVQRPMKPVRSIWSRYVAAAAILLLIISTGLNFYFFSKYKDYIAKYDDLVARQSQTAALNQNLQTKLRDYESAINHMKDPAMAVVKMPGIPTGPNPKSSATVYWDTRSKDVYLLINSLPQPSTEKQYQLWALVDGKPIDAGVFEVSQGMLLVKMKNIPEAQAFAITLEKKGGSVAPTLEAMYVMGKVAG